MTKTMNVGALILDKRLQSRVEISETTVSDYADAMLAGDVFPPVTVFFDSVHYYLADGFHRYHATRRAEKVSIECDVIPGTFRDAQLYSFGVNSKHGLRRTIEDKRQAVRWMLEDFEWSQWSNIEIAKRCDVSPSFVAKMKDEMGVKRDTVKYKTSTGEVAEKKKAEGKKPKEPELKGPEVKPETPTQDDHTQEAIDMLMAENEQLKDRVALAAMDGTEEEKAQAKQTIDELREEVRLLKIELTAVKVSRDTFQSECAQLKRQVQMQQRKIKQLGGE